MVVVDVVISFCRTTFNAKRNQSAVPTVRSSTTRVAESACGTDFSAILSTGIEAVVSSSRHDHWGVIDFGQHRLRPACFFDFGQFRLC